MIEDVAASDYENVHGNVPAYHQAECKFQMDLDELSANAKYPPRFHVFTN